MRMRLLLIRHGATAGNLEGRYIGRTDEPMLEASREKLFQMREAGFFPAPERVYTSPLWRCRETAEILFPEREAIVVPDFAECAFGAFEGKNYAELNGDPAYQAFIDSGGELAFPGGESRAEVEARVVRGLLDVLRTRERDGCDQLLAFVVHGGTILSILHHYFGGDPFSRRVGCGEGGLLTFASIEKAVSWEKIFEKNACIFRPHPLQ